MSEERDLISDLDILRARTDDLFSRTILYSASKAIEHQTLVISSNESTITALQARNLKLQNDIQEIIAKAASKHRPAYGEQQEKIMALEVRNKELEEAGRKLIEESIGFDGQNCICKECDRKSSRHIKIDHLPNCPVKAFTPVEEEKE